MAERKASVTVKLTTPIGSSDEPIEQLVLKRPLFKHVRRASDESNGKLDMARHLIATCAGVDPPIIDQLELDDFERVQSALFELMPASWLVEEAPAKGKRGKSEGDED